jgi:hypothetical protein
VVDDASKVPFKGEDISVGQLAIYAQDSYLVTDRLNLTYGLRVDFPMYFTKPVANPFSASLKLYDRDGNPETIDASQLAGTKGLFSPRVGFNYDVYGDRSTQLRGGTGIFTGRLPFVWIGNVISNQGPNPNLPIQEQTFDINAMAKNFSWPQVWTSNLAVDQKLPWELLGTLEFIYGKDINAIYVRNANLDHPDRYLPDGRPHYPGVNNLNAANNFFGGVYVIDNTSDGYNYNITAQLRKQFDFGLNASVAYTYLMAKNVMKTTEIASVLWQGNPVKGDPNKPELGYSEFGERNRITASATYRHKWSDNLATSVGLFVEVAEGNRYSGAGGNRYSYVYAGDVNGDGQGGNDLMYIPRNQSEIHFAPYTANGHTYTADEQWASFNQFIAQDGYLSSHRGQIADRFGALNEWFSDIDLRLLQDFTFFLGNQPHTFQLSFDILNLANLLNSDWGVRSVASAAATAPLVGVLDSNGKQVYDTNDGGPVFYYKGAAQKTFIDDPGVLSRWQMQIGLRYMFN